MSKPTWNHAAIAVAGALMVALAAAPADAATLVASNPGSQLLQVAVSGPQVAVDLRLQALGSASFTLALEAADIGQWLQLNAVVDNAIGSPLSALQISLSQASFVLVGSVTPQFGLLERVDGDAQQQTIRFAPAEATGFELGAAFGRAGTTDWLLVGDGAVAGDNLTFTLTAVPEPSALALLAAGLATLALRRRRA